VKRIKDLRKLSDTELEKELKSVQDALLKLRFQKVVDEVTDTTQINKKRREVAQIKTLLKERALQKAKEEQKAKDQKVS